MKLTPIKNFSKSLGTRYVKYGGFAAIITVAVVAGVIFLNLIFQQFSPQFDLTENKLFSLSEQTIQVMDLVESPVTIYGIWEPGGENPQAKEVAELYAAKGRLIRFEEVDPDLNPGLLRRFDRDNQGISRGSLVVEGAKGFRVITWADMYDVYYDQQGQPEVSGIGIEKRLTSALMYVSTGETPAVYEITGHDEILLSRLAMSEDIERENFILRELDLIRSPVPGDASALVLNNPRKALTFQEGERLKDYLDGGGRLLVMLDYRGGDAVDGLNEVLGAYGIRFDFGVAGEENMNYAVFPPYTFVPSAGSHDIVNQLVERRDTVILANPMAISVPDMRRRTVNVAPFLSSSGNSYLRTDLNNIQDGRAAGDTPGPLNLAAAVVDPEYSPDGRQARIVAVSSAILEPVSFLGQIPGNRSLFMSGLAWLENRPESLSVQSRSTFIFPLQMSQLQLLIAGLVFVAFIPLVFFVLALVTWLRRRHL